MVEDVGDGGRGSQKGDFVISPFAFSDGTCRTAAHGITSACSRAASSPMDGDGGQGEGVRVPLADGTLVSVPGSGYSDETMASLLDAVGRAGHRVITRPCALTSSPGAWSRWSATARSACPACLGLACSAPSG